ncbi:hypothetical protein H4R33_004713 [Dimargaris cristalligena]|nr:hypothetical protein H4R33_004713 [Dimargaris cristalligena]
MRLSIPRLGLGACLSMLPLVALGIPVENPFSGYPNYFDLFEPRNPSDPPMVVNREILKVIAAGINPLHPTSTHPLPDLLITVRYDDLMHVLAQTSHRALRSRRPQRSGWEASQQPNQPFHQSVQPVQVSPAVVDPQLPVQPPNPYPNQVRYNPTINPQDTWLNPSTVVNPADPAPGFNEDRPIDLTNLTEYPFSQGTGTAANLPHNLGLSLISPTDRQTSHSDSSSALPITPPVPETLSNDPKKMPAFRNKAEFDSYFQKLMSPWWIDALALQDYAVNTPLSLGSKRSLNMNGDDGLPGSGGKTTTPQSNHNNQATVLPPSESWLSADSAFLSYDQYREPKRTRSQLNSRI